MLKKNIVNKDFFKRLISIIKKSIKIIVKKIKKFLNKIKSNFLVSKDWIFDFLKRKQYHKKIFNKTKSLSRLILKYVRKNKKIISIVLFLVFYTVFWWWFFNERDVAIKEGQPTKQEVTQEIKKDKREKQKDDKKEFTDLGNFWITIDTDEVKIKAPIVNGVTPDKLDQGVGHHKTTAFPNDKQGNVVLSGHRWKLGSNPAYTVFEDLDKLKNGDRITVHYNGKDFVYEIFENKTVDSKQVEILKQTDKPILTLYTCTPKYTAFRRLVYQAKLVK